MAISTNQVKRISKPDSRIYRTAYGPSAVWLGLGCAAIGSFFSLGGFGIFPLPGKAHAPFWVIGMVGLAFLLCGLTLTGHGIRGTVHQRRHGTLRSRYRGQPCYRDYPWHQRGIHDTPASRWLYQFLGFLLMGVFLIPFNWWAFLSDDGPWPARVAVGIFDLLLLLTLFSGIYRLLQFTKFGRSHLAFSRFPFHPGEKLAVSFSPNRFEFLKATLRFVEERFEQRGSGSHRSTSHVCLEHYNESKHLNPPEWLPAVEIVFDLPDNPAWVTRLSADPAVRYWELVVESEQPGIDFRTTFPLPVYFK